MGSFVFTFVFPYADDISSGVSSVYCLFYGNEILVRQKAIISCSHCPAFAGSALLMVGTLSSFPARLDLYQFNVANYNDAMIFYMFRHF